MVAVPEHIADRFAAAWNDRNTAEIAALFADDADFVNVVGLWWESREDVRRAHGYGLRTFFRDASLSVHRTKVRQLGQDLAVVHAGGSPGRSPRAAAGPMSAGESWCSWWNVAELNGSR